VPLAVEKLHWPKSRHTHASAAPLPSSACQRTKPMGFLTMRASLSHQENTSKANTVIAGHKSDQGALYLYAPKCLVIGTMTCRPGQQVLH